MNREIEYKKIFGNFYFIGAIVYILFVYSGMLYLTLINPYSNNFDLMIHVLWVPLQVFFIMMIWSMLRWMISDPGKVPAYWGLILDDQIQKKGRYCIPCRIFKPERCYHCSKCQRCVLNMDHHCPWIGNCVGYQNRKFFILFLLYINLTVFFSVIVSFLRLCPVLMDVIFIDYMLLLNDHLVIPTILLTILLCIFGAVIADFFLFHLDLVSTNRNTIDVVFQNQTDQFDYGVKENWLQVMGTNPWLWPFPIFGESGRPKGNGVRWERNVALII